ncbi:TGBp1 family protein [Pseudoalteromonas sp. NZS71]|uniref:Triple gene block protein 1 n=1 Tax=Prunus mume chlorotic leaf curl-associated virus TaxID=3035954 RepID=A0A9Y1LX48_9VIRU|nr:TGBp1 family protein [Pseudoalteromonas sp. NZS71]WET56763.1 triple gene block protein 1 [Prunus mume chlorotic leaf curl-associated virus]
MDFVYDSLVDAGYIRTRLPVSFPIYIHCVAGAGKSTLIREILEADRTFEAFTYGVPDPINLSGIRIKAAADIPNARSDSIKIIDEYIGQELPEGTAFCFADPNQFPFSCPDAHFTCYQSKRFGNQTCDFLGKLDCAAFSYKSDQLIFEKLFAGSLEGQIVCYEKEIFDLLDRHNLEYKRDCQIRGSTFDIVTFITASDSFEPEDRYKVYLCLTRHRSVLRILSPSGRFLQEDAKFDSTT